MADDDRFSAVDYVVFSIMLLMSALIGVWYGCGPGGKQTTTAEYLLGDRKMQTWPVAISLLVTYLSAITILGVPGEIYTYGTQFYVVIFCYLFVCAAVSTVYIPMFRRIKITSVNEYLERRFSVGMRIVGCFSLIVAVTLYLFVALFAPSLALEAVTGIPLTVSILATGIVCVFYTSLGGLKAVVWTDVFQSVIILTGLVVIAIGGVLEVGSLRDVWKINEEHGRINFFDFNPDPRVRNTFWTITIGGALTVLPIYAIAQLYVQRYIAVKTLRDARRALWLNIPGLFLVITICTLDGMVIFATYANCDLKVQRKIAFGDQVLPYFVIDKLGHLKGFPGLFTACVYGAALSTMSSALNSMSLVVLEDIIKKKITLTDSDAAKISKILSAVFGGIVMAGAFAVQYTGIMVLQLTYSINGIIGGAMVAVCTLAMFVRRINSKGAYIGYFAGLAFSTWIFFGSVFYPPDTNPAVRTVSECQFFLDAQACVANATLPCYNSSKEVLVKYDNGSIKNPYKPHSTPIADLYSLSYLWLAGLSFGAAAIFAVIGSFALENKEDRIKEVDPKLLFPIKAWLLGFLPGHKFHWDEENDLAVQDEMEMESEPGRTKEDTRL